MSGESDPHSGACDPVQRDANAIAESQEMNTKMARLEQVDRVLNLVDELPLGHPDRLKFLAYAEEIIVVAVSEEEAGAPAQMNRLCRVVVPQGRSKA